MVVGFIRGLRVHSAAPCGSLRSLGSFRFALVVNGFIRDIWVHSAAPWVVEFFRSRWVH